MAKIMDPARSSGDGRSIGYDDEAEIGSSTEVLVVGETGSSSPGDEKRDTVDDLLLSLHWIADVARPVVVAVLVVFVLVVLVVIVD